MGIKVKHNKLNHKKTKKKPFRLASRKLQRFLLKAFVYLFFIGLLHVFTVQYSKGLEHGVFAYLHSFIVMYILGVYSVSIWENMGRITGSNSEFFRLAKFFKKKLVPTDDKDTQDDTEE